MPSSSGYADSARQQAHQILSQAPYATHQAATPRPLAGLLHAIGRGLDIVFGPVLRWILHHVIQSIGTGTSNIFGAWAPVVGIVAAVAVGSMIALILVRRRSRIGARPGDPVSVTTLTDPADLEAEADELAAKGAFAAAVRLLFEAGLLRLERAGLIANQRTSTDAELALHIGSPTFDGLAHRHEAVAYAGQPAAEGDVDDARSGWPRVPDEARTSRSTAGASSG